MRLVVLGGGPAGIEAARAAAPHANVTLVSATAPGAWRPLVSQVWLAAVTAGMRDLLAIGARAARAAAAWQERCAVTLAALDVELLTGRARLVGPGQVELEADDASPARQLAADAVIVACGAHDVFPAGLAPDQERIIGAAELDILTALPASVLVLGDGPSGFELCHIFSLLGTTVTWLVPDATPHSRLTPEVDGYLTRLLERQGVQLAPRANGAQLDTDAGGVTATTPEGASYQAEVAVLTTLRRSDPEALGLPAAQAATDVYGQTKWRGVYLVDDDLEPATASVAMAQARAAALHAVRRSSAPADIRHIVRSFMAQPQVAKLGRLATEGAHGSVTVALAEGAAAYVHDTPEGFLTLTWDQAGRVAGALAVAPAAADLLAPLALAMRLGLRLDELTAGYAPHPSLGELVALAARKMER